MKRSKTISVIVCLIMTLSFVLGSFSVAFAANNDGDSFIYSNSTYKYTFDELLDEFLQTCDGFGTVFTYKDVFFVFHRNSILNPNGGVYLPAYNKNVDGLDWNGSFLNFNNKVEIVEQATYITNHLGYNFVLVPEESKVNIGSVATHYYTGADGNRLQSGGGGTGAGREHPYYTSPGIDNTLPSTGDNYYVGDTIDTQIIDNSTGAFNNIGNGNVINAGEGDFIYNPDNRTWYVTNHNDNRTYTTNNYYTYNTVNYYMPGSDQPLNTWNYYYELPDGRNSATLTEEDIAGLNLDFDVVNYKQASEDLSQKALFHLDGNIDNSAPSVDDVSAKFEFTLGAGYTFVDTQTPFNAALYLDGNAHIIKNSLPDNSLVNGDDFTFSFRWYQEKSTSSAVHNVYIGGSSFNNGVLSLTFNGSNITRFGNIVGITTVIPAGQWNTFTIVRIGTMYSLYLNGLLVIDTSMNIPFAANEIYINLAADDNVKYIDEILFASVPLYSEPHVPRLIPWDTTNVLVLPEVTENSIAVMATIPITGYRIGGVRPTFPDTGMVWMLVEGDYITSIQIYNGYMWVEIGGAVYYNGHWYQLENFNIHVTYDDIDTPPNSDVVNPNKPSGGGSGSGSGGSGGGWLDTLFQELLSGVVDLIVEAIKALIGLIENVLGAVADFIGACFSVITIPLEWMQPMGDFIGGLFAIFPSEIQLVYTAGFALIILCSVIMWISGKH